MRRFLPAGAAVLGAALVVAGVVVFVAANRSGVTSDFGWSSYAPLQPEGAYDSRLALTFSDRWSVLWTGLHLLGALLAVAGLLVLTGLGGWFLGRRPPARR